MTTKIRVTFDVEVSGEFTTEEELRDYIGERHAIREDMFHDIQRIAEDEPAAEPVGNPVWNIEEGGIISVRFLNTEHGHYIGTDTRILYSNLDGERVALLRPEIDLESRSRAIPWTPEDFIWDAGRSFDDNVVSISSMFPYPSVNESSEDEPADDEDKP